MAANNRIYQACYSNVPVYEYNAGPGVQIMRRRADDWINATHILKAAAYDKPARTRILEREVQKGVHEKVQGGYGKYQGTWIPLHDGRALAERNGVLEKLLPIFDFVPGEHSPPPAPKHATAASSRPRAARQTAAQRRLAMPTNKKNPSIDTRAAAVVVPTVTASQISEDQYDAASVGHYAEDETPDNITIISESLIEDDYGQYNSRKRKREQDQMSLQDQQHQIWADQLLDYFMLLESEDRFPCPPEPPAGVNLDRPIDEKGNSALHWAAAMGDIDVVKDLIARGARIDCLSNNLETPLMRAVMFTNNYDKQTMGKLVRILAPTVVRTDWFGSTVFHHIAATTSSKNKYLSARYYLDTVINVLSETWIPDEVTRLLNVQDQNGDSAIMIAARNGARKCVRSLLGRNVQVDVPNAVGETADDLIRELNARRRAHNSNRRDVSSSPFAPDLRGVNGEVGGPAATPGPIQIPPPQYHSQTAMSLMSRIAPTIMDKFRHLATAYEAEYGEKEQEEAEAERVVRKRIAEMEALKRQLADVAGDTEMAYGPTEEDEAEEAELRRLEEEAEALLELEQREDLRGLIGKAQGANGVGNLPADARQLALKLAQVQGERQRLVRDIVRSLSVAGLGEKQAEYKRLIRGAMGVKENDVESMLDEILGQLEEEHRERAVMEEG
ncbi:apses-domain-containing protein [Trichodelitschia bisporula]|uniref:Apses-domain-containing protein n=1 Tax=Trichodelitschia bisporula TaxID=703511 RepID=A0A6G1HNP2_9PEZI|nr:apses-domain-containing protein [Trichodelitschia bisporula]